MDKEKQYYFDASFFEYVENISKIYDAFKKCMEILDVPVDVSLIFDKESPKGRLILKKIN